MEEGKFKRVVVALTVGAVLLLTVLLSVMVYQIVAILNSQRELAELSGLSYQTIRTKLYRDNMPFADAEKILDLLGYEICIIDKETKKPLL